ncbi:MAG: ArsR family transcriptional regulator [Acidimicrobiia bacterium]
MNVSSQVVNYGLRLPIFRSPEQQRLLGELFVFADTSLSLTELAARADTSLSGAHKEVERLEAAGLVKSHTVGRARHVEADQSSPLYPELRRLLLKIMGPEPMLRSALANIHGIRQAFIYGSWADPTQRSPADIDILVVGDPDVGAVYDAVSGVEAQVERPVNVTIRSPAEWDGAEGAFERAVRSSPRIELI